MTPITKRPNRTFGLAPVRRWDPLTDLLDLQDRMGQLTQAFFATPLSFTPGRLPVLAAPADIEETDDGFIVELDLPNVRPEDVSVELRDENELRVYGEIRPRDYTGVVRRQDRRVGQFEHLIVLPADVDPEHVDATLANGVLTVRLAKTREHQPRRIEVKTGGDGGEPSTGGQAEGSGTG